MMGMQHAMLRHETSDPEYSIYIHHANENDRSACKWEKASTTKDRSLAMEQAHMLFYSDRYEKVEVKKKFFCQSRKKNIGETLKVYCKQGSRKWYYYVLSVLALSLMAVTVALI